MNNRQRQTGLTLLEMLVALAIFAVLGVVSYASLDSVLETRQTTRTNAERLAQLQFAMQIVERDIEQLAPRPIRDEFGQTRPALDAGPPPALLTFTRAGWANPLGQARAGLQRVSYRLQDRRLLRDVWPVLDRGRQGAAEATVLLDGVERVTARFFGPARQWRTGWPQAADRPAQLPQALELTIVLRGWGEITRLFRLVENVESDAQS